MLSIRKINCIKSILVNLWIFFYRNFLFIYPISISYQEKIVKDYFTQKNPKFKKRKLLFVMHEEIWAPPWISSLSMKFNVELLFVKKNLRGNRLDNKLKSLNYDLVIWYLSADNYSEDELSYVRKFTKYVARIHWDDEFNFFLPKKSNPLIDAKKFDFLFSSSAIAVLTYRKLGFNAHLLFNGMSPISKSDLPMNETYNAIQKIVFVGSFTENRHNFISQLSNLITSKIFVYGKNWPKSDKYIYKGLLKDYSLILKYNAILNINFISLSTKYTHYKLRDFEFLSADIPVLMHQSIENKYIKGNVILFSDLNDLAIKINDSFFLSRNIYKPNDIKYMMSYNLLNKSIENALLDRKKS